MTSQDQNIVQSQINDSFVQQVQAGGDVSIQQTVIIYDGQKIQLVYSDPLPDRSFFQGRQAELAQLGEYLQDRTVAIIGVRGEGGIGKSTLAAKAFEVCPGFQGKCWIDVRTGTSITELAERALQEFGLPFHQVQAIEKKDLPQRLLRQLQTGRFLLAIDNLESILTATGEWQTGYDTFLDEFPDLGGESVLLLASREYPPHYFGWRRSRWFALEHGLKPTEGAALLAALEVEDTAENRENVSVQVQGNPLALSLIAGWLRQTYRAGERILAHLQQQSDLWQLEGRHRGEQPISIERVLQWSMDRLPLALQYLLTQVSVLRGAFNTEAAGALVLEQSVSEADLDDLERRTLLQTLPRRDKYGLRAFRLQPRIRDFVQKRATNLTTAHERAITYFWNRRTLKFAKEDTQEAIAEYEETFYHQCQLGLYSQAAITVSAFNYFLRRRGYYQILVNFYSQLYTDWQPNLDDRQDYAYICLGLGNTCFFLGQFEKAIIYLEQSLSINTEIDNQDGKAKSLNDLGDTYQSLGQSQKAILLHEEAVAIAREIGDREEEAFALNNLGTAYDSLGQYEQGIFYLEEALAIEREINNRRGEANSLMNLGNIYRELGQHKTAGEFHQKSLEIMREIGDRDGEAKSLCNLGIVYCDLGKYQQAIKFHQQSLEIEREIGNRSSEANSLCNLGRGLARLDDHFNALQSYKQALVIYEDLKLDHMVEQCKTAIATCSKIIPVERRRAPPINDKKQKKDDWWEKNLPTPAQQTGSHPKHQSSTQSQPWLLWFAVGLTFALLVWWLRR